LPLAAYHFFYDDHHNIRFILAIKSGENKLTANIMMKRLPHDQREIQIEASLKPIEVQCFITV
jgi:hypothetical protein